MEGILRLILAVTCVATLVGDTFAYKRCGSARWGRKNDNIGVQHKADIGVGNYRASVQITPDGVGCDIVGMEVISCDVYEEPVVSFTDDSHVLIRRNFAAGTATVNAVTYCEPVNQYYVPIGLPLDIFTKRPIGSQYYTV